MMPVISKSPIACSGFWGTYNALKKTTAFLITGMRLLLCMCKLTEIYSCNGSFSVVSFCFYTIFTPQRHWTLWRSIVFCKLYSLKNQCNMGIYEKKWRIINIWNRGIGLRYLISYILISPLFQTAYEDSIMVTLFQGRNDSGYNIIFIRKQIKVMSADICRIPGSKCQQKNKWDAEENRICIPEFIRNRCSNHQTQNNRNAWDA